MSTTPEQRLIERCWSGDEDAFRELVNGHKRLVFALIARSTHDLGRAEELSQEVFLRVHRGLPYFRGESRLSTWIYRVVSNVLAEERKPGRPVVISLDERRPDSGLLRIEPAVADRAFGDLELRDRLEKAIGTLPAPYQMLVNGHYLEGCVTRTWPPRCRCRWVRSKHISTAPNGCCGSS